MRSTPQLRHVECLWKRLVNSRVASVLFPDYRRRHVATALGARVGDGGGKGIPNSRKDLSIHESTTPSRLQWANRTIAALGILLVGGIGASIVQAQQAQASHAQAAAGYTSPASYTPPPAPTEVAFLGDSFTVGTGAEKKFDRWTTLLAQEMEWIELNYGFGGTNFGTAGTLKGGRPYHERLTDLILSQPDIVIVSSAGNTLSVNQEQGIEATFQNIREGLPDARIIALSPLSRSGEYRKELVSFGKDLKAAVEKVDGEYVDVGHPLEDHPQAMDADGVHPNNVGHQMIADAAAGTLGG